MPNGSSLRASRNAKLSANPLVEAVRSDKVRMMSAHRVLQCFSLVAQRTAVGTGFKMALKFQAADEIQLSINVSVDKLARFLTAHRLISCTLSRRRSWSSLRA